LEVGITRTYHIWKTAILVTEKFVKKLANL